MAQTFASVALTLSYTHIQMCALTNTTNTAPQALISQCTPMSQDWTGV